MLILTIDAALARCHVSLIDDGRVLSTFHDDGRLGQSQLASFTRKTLTSVAAVRDMPHLIAVTVGPGSFTGVRAALSLAHGIGLALGVPVIGVTIGEALSEALPLLPQRRLWCATGSRRGRVFLEDAGMVSSYALNVLPLPSFAVAVAGDAALAVAASIAARGGDVMLTSIRVASAIHIASAAFRRHSGGLPPRATQPLYVDPPEAKLPPGGLRPEPQADPSRDDLRVIL